MQHDDHKYSGITADSRKIHANMIFVAIAGNEKNGTDYIDDAITKGASLIVTEDKNYSSDRVKVHYTHNARHYYAQAAAEIYAPLPSHLLAVSGTNGKSSIVHFCKEIWRIQGKKGASVGTLGVYDTDSADNLTSAASPLTTPDSGALCQILHQLKSQDINQVALEASSHGLDQFRLDGLRFETAALGELSQDHLDYHGSLEKYYGAKLRLFHELAQDNARFIYLTHSPLAKEIEAIGKQKRCDLYPIGYDDQARLHIHNITPQAPPHPHGNIIEFSFDQQNYQIFIPLMGRFQCENFLTSLLMVSSSDSFSWLAKVDYHDIQAVPGRCEFIKTVDSVHFFVDFAHTEDALRTILQALIPHKKAHRLIVVFGCGGNRDPYKRSKMGRVAHENADIVIVTDDNPRNEDPSAIRAAIMQTCPHAIEIPDRKEAISYAFQCANHGDIILVAGKGHETGQEINNQILPFHDKAIIMRLNTQQQRRK